MIMIIDECVDCTSMGLHCQGASCSNRRQKIHVCDNCNIHDTLYYFEGGEYCIDCIIDMLEIVEDD